MRIRVGNQSAYSAPRLLVPFEFAAEHRFDAFEFFPDAPGPGLGWTAKDLDPRTRTQLRRVAEERDIRLSVHACLRSTPTTDEGLAALAEDIGLARDLDARLVNIHLDLSRGMEAFVAGVLAVVDDLGNLGIDLVIENTPATGPDAFNELFEHLVALGLHRRCELGMCLDLGHANLHEATRNDYLAYIDALDSKVPILHVHAHENYGDADSHLTMFTGPSAADPSGVRGWLGRLGARGFVGSLILEQWPDPPSLLIEARDRLRKMAAEIGSPATKPESQEAEIPHRIPDEAVAAIAQADKSRPSWREKLAWVEKFLSESGAGPGLDDLALMAIYLRFVGTGEVPCEEGGGHFRPSHHAQISGRILERLESLRAPETTFVIRRIQPWLPSSNEAFTRSEPLTRIRDIAHRNDIPKALKDEIKHTLQNKLHRNAGPEDLQTSASLLARFEANRSDYPNAFIQEFRRFHAELQEFFHARSVRDQLEALLEDAPAEPKRLVGALLDEMDTAETLDELVRLAGLVTAVRSWLRAVQERERGAAAQSATLTEIRLEEYAFTVLSQVNNELEAQQDTFSWRLALVALIDLVEGLALGGVEAEDCNCIAKELRTWREDFDPQQTWQLQRMAASVERARRVATTFARHVEDLFGDKIEALGAALGVDAHSRALLAEAEIRTHCVFQLSRLTGTLLGRCQDILKDGPWDIVVPGKTVGRLLQVERLDKAELDDVEPYVVMTHEVAGDEVLSRGLTGLVVGQEVPHLSHLAIRARQRGVVLLCAREPKVFARARVMVGQIVVLDTAAPSEDMLRLATQRDVLEPPSSRRRGEASRADGSERRPWVPLEEVTAATGGAKAASARALVSLSRSGELDFKAPRGMVVPFGVMERALRANRAEQRRYNERVQQLFSEPGRIEDNALALRDLVLQVEVPAEIEVSAVRWFGAGSRLVVRSSANTEDLVDVSSAGLYESVVNVGVDDVADAIRQVWASLWAPRAVVSRMQEGQREGARMAVLVQKMIPMEYAFVVHTTHPTRGDRNQVYIELVPGMGEGLARADAAGTPYRMIHDERDDHVRIAAFDSFSQARWPAARGGLERRWLDHTGLGMSTDRAFQESLTRRIARVSRGLAAAQGGAQDIEGGIKDGQIIVVQSRPQQGVSTS